MTDEQKFFFDLKGWIVLPSVLTDNELEAMRAECRDDTADTLSKHHTYARKQGYEGVLQELLDHPAIVPILSEILSEEPFERDDCYGFRCEGTYFVLRTVRQPESARGANDPPLPHVIRPPQQANAMNYQVRGGKIFSGLTRVVWELEEVVAGQGGTSFLSGSHKAHFNYGGPDRYTPNIGGSPWEDAIRPSMDTYSCPAGSVVIFTESLIHAANHWTNPNNPRCAVFNAYNSVWACWHQLNVPHEVVETMPKKRQSLFRGVWQLGGNTEYSAANRAF